MNDTARIAREYIAKLEGKVAKLETDRIERQKYADEAHAEVRRLTTKLKRTDIAKRSLSKMFENTRDELRNLSEAVSAINPNNAFDVIAVQIMVEEEECTD